jgi:predicted dehydrogenase
LSPTGSGPVRVGVIGCGAIACWAHLPALARIPTVALVAAADPDPVARSKASRWSRMVHATAGEILARPDVEAVVVTVPPHCHAEVVEAACAAGKHVYLEKPLAASLEDAARIVSAAERFGVTVVVGFNRRLHPTFLRARAAVRAGLIGRVRTIQSRFCETTGRGSLSEWRRRRGTGGGVLLDLGTHHVDLARWLTGEEVVSAAARLASDASEQDGAWARWTLSGGVEVQSFFSYRTATEDRMALIGERGVIRIDRHRFALSIEVAEPGTYGTRARFSLPGPSELLGRLAGAVGYVYEPSYRRSLQAFAERVRGPASGVARLEDGMRALQAVPALEA